MMRLPLEWLGQYVSIRLTPDRLAERLTMIGLEVTGRSEVEGTVVFDLEITPNRPDCLSIIGLAREVAAATGQRLKIPVGARGTRHGARKPPFRPSPLAPRPRIHVEDQKGCPQYIGQLIEHIRIGPSPERMARRLRACGLRPISNVVDITNYVLLETGQPLHAFDADTLVDASIVVRRAKPSETLVTIDGGRCTLSSEMLVIADAKRPVAVAGVMGGQETAVTTRTRRVLLESAEFDPLSIRRTARALGLASESSYRFERGIDPEGVAFAAGRAARLIEELADGRVVSARRVGKRPGRTTTILLDANHTSRRLGAAVPAAKVTRLNRLGFSVAKRAGGWRITPPAFRRDVTRDVDVIEELARLHGYDRLPETVPVAPIAQERRVDRADALSRTIRDTCAALNLWEIVTWSLISQTELERIGLGAQAASWNRIANPLSRDHAILRPTLVVGLLKTVSSNLAQGAHGVRLFELGRVFSVDGDGRETLHIGLVVAGAWEHGWQGTKASDLFRLKGLVEQLVALVTGFSIQANPTERPWAEAGRCMTIAVDGRPIGVLGEVSQAARDANECRERVWVAELSVPALDVAKPLLERIQRPSSFPPVKRDLSIIVGQQIEFACLLDTIRRVGAPLASRIELVDRFTGSQIPAGKQSLTFSIEYRDPARTLVAAEVDERHRAISDELARQFHAQLR